VNEKTGFRSGGDLLSRFGSIGKEGGEPLRVVQVGGDDFAKKQNPYGGA